MPPVLQDGEISMRHFPDLSDSSFLIPAAQDHMLTDELHLGAFDDSELWEGLDADPFTTPMPRPKRHAPLTLSEITPRRERTTAIADTSSSSSEAVDECPKQKLDESSVRSVLPKKESVDDMFQRRKRDSYQHMGIDLTSKSTARLRRRAEGAEGARAGTSTRNEPLGVVNVGPTARRHAGDGSRGKRKRSVLGETAGIVKHKARVPPAQHIQPKSILKPSKPASALPHSTLSRTMTALSQTPKAERPKWGDVVAEVQQASRGPESRGSGIGTLGGGLIDVLVMYGEKLKGSLGFSSSGNTPTNSSNLAPTLPTEHFHDNRQNLMDYASHPPNTAGPSSNPLTLSDLTPSRSEDRRRNEPLTLSELSPRRQSPPALSDSYEESGDDEPRQLETSPMRPSRKRRSTGSPKDGRKKGRMKAKLTAEGPESSKHAIERAYAAAKPVSKPKALGPSHAANGAHKNANLLRPRAPPSSTSNAAANAKLRLAAVSSGDLKGKRVEASSAKAHSRRAHDKEQHPPPSSSALSGPVVASDVYRQRALDKAQAEREKREEEKRKKAFKAGTMSFNKPAPPARSAGRTTVPAAFTFHSDARAAQRNAEFEEKRKTWESRSTRHALPMPDFAAMHAAEAGAVRPKRAVPVLPTEAPALMTMMRAKEREKFEEERRARDMATEKLREMREKERAMQEEKEYREARKRTVPKAHEVPEWYKTVPKRKEVD